MVISESNMENKDKDPKIIYVLSEAGNSEQRNSMNASIMTDFIAVGKNF